MVTLLLSIPARTGRTIWLRAAKFRPHSSSPSVDVVQADQDWPRNYPPASDRMPRDRRLEPQAAMRSVAIVVVRELSQPPAQVALVDHDHVVEALGPNRPYDPLGHGVGFRRPW